MKTLLNTSIITSHGACFYAPITLAQAKNLCANGAQSAIGHQVTADILAELLDIAVVVNRIE